MLLVANNDPTGLSEQRRIVGVGFDEFRPVRHGTVALPGRKARRNNLPALHPLTDQTHADTVKVALFIA